MSVHFSKWLLNTYAATPFFQAHVPADYPLSLVMIKSRTFHGLPARLRELAKLAKAWACRAYPYPAGVEGIEQWYDAEGFELNPDSGRRLTAAEIESEWAALGYGPAELVETDIPIPPGGFADPATWESPEDAPELVDRADLTEDQILRDIASRGRDWTAGAYGVPETWLADVKTDQDLVTTILQMDGQPWPLVDSRA